MLLSAGIGAAVNETRHDRRWLWALLGGVTVAASPLLMLVVHGSWDAQYEMPRRHGSAFTFRVSWYGVVALVTGLLLVVMGIAMRLRLHLQKGRGKR